EQVARARGDAAKVLLWIQRQREQSDDAFETAFHAVREALELGRDDLASAESLVRRAVDARPGDLALRELFERVSAGGERGRWREDLASSVADSRVKSWLLLEAAYEYERAGAPGD